MLAEGTTEHIFVADEDEDGDRITVRSDTDVDGFKESLAAGSVNRLFIGKILFMYLLKHIFHFFEIESRYIFLYLIVIIDSTI